MEISFNRNWYWRLSRFSELFLPVLILLICLNVSSGGKYSDFITAGTPVFSVLPSDNPILGQVYLPSQGAGKVAVGQDVIIKLDNYPYIEYGSVSGNVKTISQLSSQTVESAGQNKINTYLITVDLPSELTTNYGTKLDFRFEIKGIADILIKRRKLLERLFDNLKYITSKK